ncbi:FAD/NAD(P)-binding protein [Micromonospora sp. CPCC 205539]|uniref:FAD/NAD(P)-binding protein n=1 Tax=Micromonospora sp. CPCC 205539 TaxID=3122408 RepID=UPI002FF212C2
MNPALEGVDLLIVGAGLSGSRLFVELVTLWETETDPPPSVALVDRLGAFGRGVPYGMPSRPGSLLIEPVTESTPPEFHTWLREHPEQLLPGVAADVPALADWHARNAAQLTRGDLTGVRLPRHTFGAYAEQQHSNAVALARGRWGADVREVVGEVVDLRGEDSGWQARCADGSRLPARVVVLAIGSVPRLNRTGLDPADGYVHDLYDGGFEQIDALITGRRRSRIVVIGSNAAAAELLHYLTHTPGLLERVATIEVISGSGRLPGRPDPAGLRPSPREYMAGAERLEEIGKLVTRSGRVTGVARTGPGLQLRLASADTPVDADIVVDCTGAGRMDDTASSLLANLVGGTQGFTPDPTRRGLRMDPVTFEVEGAPHVFVIGPLLNRDAIATHVESINAVHRTAAHLAPYVHQRLRKLRGAAATAIGSPGAHH